MSETCWTDDVRFGDVFPSSPCGRHHCFRAEFLYYSMSWEIIQFQRDIYFVSSPLPFGEEAVVAPSLGSGPPCPGVVGLSSCSEISEQACWCPVPQPAVQLGPPPSWGFIRSVWNSGLHRCWISVSWPWSSMLGAVSAGQMH